MIPDLKTSDVELKGPPAEIQREPFHQQLVLGKDRVASIARFAVTWSARDRSDAVMRQASVPDLVLDEKTKRFLVHRANCARFHPVGARTPRPQSSEGEHETAQL